MDFKKIKDFIKLAKDEGLKKLSYEDKSMKLSVEVPFESSSLISAPSVVSSANEVSSTTASVENKSKDLKNVKLITSPLVGTFYRSPSPEAPPFVQVGQKVSKGQVLCILESMKIMNEIESEFSGEIIEVCVENESLIEFGQVLFKLKV